MKSNSHCFLIYQKTMQRQIRHCALLLFPGESLNPETIDQIASEGFTDVGIAVFMKRTGRHFSGQGFSVKQGRHLAELAEERKLGLIAFTGYMKYQEDLARTCYDHNGRRACAG